MLNYGPERLMEEPLLRNAAIGLRTGALRHLLFDPVQALGLDKAIENALMASQLFSVFSLLASSERLQYLQGIGERRHAVILEAMARYLRSLDEHADHSRLGNAAPILAGIVSRLDEVGGHSANKVNAEVAVDLLEALESELERRKAATC